MPFGNSVPTSCGNYNPMRRSMLYTIPRKKMRIYAWSTLLFTTTYSLCNAKTKNTIGITLHGLFWICGQPSRPSPSGFLWKSSTLP